MSQAIEGKRFERSITYVAVRSNGCGGRALQKRTVTQSGEVSKRNLIGNISASSPLEYEDPRALPGVNLQTPQPRKPFPLPKLGHTGLRYTS